MVTTILDAANPKHIELCAETIRSGGLVAIPTETVYGLGANALDESAVAGIFTTKGRKPDNPLIVHVAYSKDIKDLVREIPDVFESLADKCWPGPLTLIMKKSERIPQIVSAGLDTVAIRIPNHAAALALISASGCPIAAPSANPSGSPSPTKAIHVKNDIGGKIPYILDGGDCAVGLESTVLDISEATPLILRPGAVTYDELKKILKNVEICTEIKNQPPRSPGMKYRHYAPKAPLTAILGEPSETAEYIRAKMDSRTAALMFDDYKFDHPNVIAYGASDDFKTQAAMLFDALRTIDSMEITNIYAQVPEENRLGLAIANRIKKAAGKNITDLQKTRE